MLDHENIMAMVDEVYGILMVLKGPPLHKRVKSYFAKISKGFSLSSKKKKKGHG